MFKHSPKDAYLVLISWMHLLLLIAPVFCFNELSFLALLTIGCVQASLYAMNYQCTAHNFLHNPFFTSNLTNRVFSVMNTISLGSSQTMYKYYHYNHHRYDNDIPTVYGETKDRTSTYRWSKNIGEEESLWTYALLGIVRAELPLMWEDAKKKGELLQVRIEQIALISWIISLFIINWRYGLFYIAIWYVGQTLAIVENYLEHHQAPNTNKLNNSVSAYAGWYNWIWFNNGYHQEHHYRPQTHWTEIPDVTKLMLPTSRRRIVSCHWFNFGTSDKTLVSTIDTEKQTG